MIKEFRLTHEQARNTVISVISQLPVDNKHPLRIVIDEDKRSSAQNRMMWAVLNDIAKQVNWNGEQLTAEEWKHLITANLHGQKCVKGIQGGLVFMGLSTRKMNKKEFADVVTCAEQFGAENGVKFSNNALEAIRIAEAESLLKFLHEQRREIINRNNLNKNDSNVVVSSFLSTSYR